MPCDPTTFFGVWSAAKLQRVTELLNSLSVRYEVQEEELNRETLERWCAWDANAQNPNVGFNLWIWYDDLPKVGNKIADEFPERKFGG
jgi:hypothetical protein